jgi:transposase
MAQQESVGTSAKATGSLPRLAPVRVRRWPVDVKRRIVEETLVPGASVSIVARRHDVNTNQVFTWRQLYRRGELGHGTAENGAMPPDFVPVGMVISSGPAVKPLSLPAPSSKVQCASVSETGRRVSMIEIALRGGIKVRVDASIDEAALHRVLAVVKEVA